MLAGRIGGLRCGGPLFDLAVEKREMPVKPLMSIGLIQTTQTEQVSLQPIMVSDISDITPTIHKQIVQIRPSIDGRIDGRKLMSVG